MIYYFLKVFAREHGAMVEEKINAIEVLPKQSSISEIDRSVLTGLELASLGLGIFFACYMLGEEVLHGASPDLARIFGFGGAAVIFLLIGTTFRRLKIASGSSHASIGVLYGLGLLTLIFLHRMMGETLQTSLFLMLLAGVGCLVLSRLWFALLQGSVLIAWGIIAFFSPPSVPMSYLPFTMFVAMAIGFIVMRSRLASIHYAERRRIVEQERIEAYLQTAEQRLRLVANNARDIIFYWRLLPEVKLEYINPAVAHILGYSPEEWYAEPSLVWRTVHPEDRTLLTGIWIEKSADTKPVSMRFQAKDGSWVWLEQYSSPICTSTGEVVAIEGIARDVTKRNLTEIALKESQAHLTDALKAASRANERLEAEIVERSRVEADLSAAEAKFRTLVEGALLGICILQEGRFQYVNPMFAHILGYSESELQGGLAEFFVFQADKEIFRLLLAHAVEKNTGELNYIFRGRHRDGRVLTLHALGTPIVYNGVKSIIGSILDITERKHWESKLRESKRALATLISNLPGIAYRCSNDEFWTMEFISEGCLEMTGYAPDDLLGNRIVPFVSLIHPDDRDYVARSIRRALESKAPYRLLYRIRTRAGTEKWVSEQGRGVYGSEGILLALEGFMTDVTEQRRAELALAVSEERLRLALEAAQVGIWDWDIKTDRMQWSGGAATIFGCEMRDLAPNLGSYISKVYHEDRQKFKDGIDRALATSSPFDFTYRIVRGDGATGWVNSKGSVWSGEEGQPVRMIGNVTDITERMVHEEMLTEAKDKAEEANRVKSVIFANMSHEIRTPMTAILGYSDLLTQRLRGTAMQKDVETIYQGGVRLLHLLNSIIDLARIEAGRTEMHPIYHPIHESIARVTGLLKVLADQKNILIVQDVDPELMVFTDAHAEEQVFTNLLGNAIRFTERGTITITAARAPFGPSRVPMAIIRIEDTGIGISETFLPQIFNEFRQESEGFGRQHEGSGLGLSITKKLVEKMTGSIEIASQKAKGTAVTVALPLAAKMVERSSEERGTLEVAQVQKPRRNILVVEDDKYCGQLLQRMLSDTNQVIWCETAELAIERALQEHFDVVLMDINLKHGKLNGIQGLHELRKLDQYASVPILAVTAYAMKGDRERFIAEGFSGYIAKPFEPVQLRSVIDLLPVTGAGASPL